MTESGDSDFVSWKKEEENRKLKQLVAGQALDIVRFKAVLSKSEMRRTKDIIAA